MTDTVRSMTGRTNTLTTNESSQPLSTLHLMGRSVSAENVDAVLNNRNGSFSKKSEGCDLIFKIITKNREILILLETPIIRKILRFF